MSNVIDTKQCTRCGEEKSVEEFNRYARSRDGLKPRCRSCQSEDGKHYHAANKGTINDAKRQRYANSEDFRRSRKDSWATYYDNNREMIRDRSRMQAIKRRSSDPIERWVHKTRSRLSRILKGAGSQPEALELLGCTGEEWRSHLESTFKPGMTWDNHGRGEGKWEIDHIMPVSSFDQEDHLQRLICWNHRNTQALWSHENMAKGDTIITEGGAA